MTNISSTAVFGAKSKRQAVLLTIAVFKGNIVCTYVRESTYSKSIMVEAGDYEYCWMQSALC
jgi:hypothetical protein